MSNEATEYMQRAIRLAGKGLYTTDPNPRVGCVLVKDGKIVGEGWHHSAGGPHAEIVALQQAGSNAKGSTAYVTLEPCCHTGKTPPCTDALLKSGVSKVVAAMKDPNPLVAGKGLQLLQSNGIETQCGLLEAQSQQLNPGFIKRMSTGLPYVRVKMAMSLDGRTAMASGESQWITAEAARLDVQRLRARSSVILTGIETVLADDPTMNVRLTSKELGIESEVRQPIRVILDSNLRLPVDARICASGASGMAGDVAHGEVVVLTGIDDAGNYPGCQVVTLPTAKDIAGETHVSLTHAMQYLAAREINEVLVESGPVLGGALLQRNIVDEIIIYIAPCLMGDAARGLFSLPGLSRMRDKMQLDILDVRTVGKDIRVTAKPVYV